MSRATLRRHALLLLPLLLAGCGTMETKDSAPRQPVDTSQAQEPIPRAEPRSKYGNPASYVVHGREYRLLPTSEGYVERGIASWYGTKFHGKRTSSGEAYDMYAMSAAHKTLPIPCYARVTNLENGRSVIVRINDRGPFHENRIIDLSYAAAIRLGINTKGTGMVEVRTLTSNDDAPPQSYASSTATRSGSPRLYLQVGAFVNRNNADQLRLRLANSQIPYATVQEASRPEGPVYRVRVGPLGGTEEADAIASRIATLGVGLPQIVID